MVVDDHVALLDLVLEAVEEAADVPGQRADVHRRRVGLAQLAALGVEDAGAEVLGLADDRRVAHPEEDARHLLGDRVERAAEHAQGDRVDLDALARRRPGLAADLVVRDAHAVTSVPATSRLRLGGRAESSITMFPKRSTCAVEPGRDHRRRVVLVDDRRARRAGCPALQRGAVVVARRHLLRARRRPRNHASPSWRSAVVGRLVAVLDLGRLAAAASGRSPRTRMFGISMSDSSKRREYSRSWMSWKSRADLLDPGVVDRRRTATSTRSS